MQSIVWFCCFLYHDHPAFDCFSALGLALQRMGMKLIIFGGDCEALKGRPGFDYIGIPHRLAEQGRWFADFFAGEGLPMGAATLREMIEIDRAFGMDLPESEAELYILRATSFWERAFDIMQPSVVVTWGTSIPFSRLLFRLAQRRQVPAYAMERGLMENTFSLSLAGQVSMSNVNTSPSLIRPPNFDAARRERWNTLETYYRGMVSQQAPDINREPAPEEEDFLKTDPSPRVLFLGGFDTGSGTALTDPVFGERFGTWVATSSDAAQRTAAALAKLAPGASFWSKMHTARNPRVAYSVPAMDGLTVRNCTNLNVHRLVEAADICVTLSSTTQYLSFVYDKPLLVLANSFFMGRDIGYEVASEQELEPMLAAALKRETWDERRDKGRNLLVSMMECDLFALNETVPARLQMSDLALLWGRFARYVKPGLASSEERIAAFHEFRALAEGGRGALKSRIDWQASQIAWYEQHVANLERDNAQLRETLEMAPPPHHGLEKMTA